MTDTYRPEDLDWAMGQFRSNDDRNTRRVLSDPTAPNPEEESQVRRTAERAGLPEADVRLDLAGGERVASAAETGAALQQTPRLRQWMNEPRNAHVARDDVENLSTFERLARAPLEFMRAANADNQQIADASLIWSAQNPLTAPLTAPLLIARATGGNSRSVIDQFQEGERDTEYAGLAFRSHQAQLGRADALTPEEQARLDELANRPNQSDWGPLIVGPTARLAPQMLGSLDRAGRQTETRMRELGTEVYGSPDAARDQVRRALNGDLRAGADLAVASGLYAMGAPLALAGGFGGGYLSFGNEMETGLAYDQMIRAGVDPTIAADRATQYGAWATALEFAGDALGLRFAGGGKLLARAVLGEAMLQSTERSAATALTRGLIETGLDQGAEEASQELAQILHQNLALQETETGRSDVGQAWRDALTPEALQQMLFAGWVGFQGGVGMGAVPAGTNFALDMRASAVAEHNARVFEEWTRAAQASRLNERGLTSTLESAVGAMDDSTVYVDADRFVEHFQGAGVNPYIVADELGLGEQALAQAIAAHGQVEIPTSTFAARVLRVPAHAGLAEHARLSPNDATPAEVRMAGEVLRADIERLATETAAVQTDNEIGAIVEERMLDLFSRAAAEGGPRSAVASRYSRLVAAMPRALLARARATNPAYADRLEQQFRRFFGERMDVAGPARGAATAEASQLDQGRRGVDPRRGSEPFNDPRLTATENKAVEMARNNYSNDEIADELDTSNATVSALLSKAKKKAPDLAIEPNPMGPRPGTISATGEQTVSTERLVKMYEDLLAAGYTNKAGPGGDNINTILARRTGMKPSAVAVRLSKYRKARLAAELAAVREPAPKSAMEQRRAWVAEHVVRRGVPDGAPGDYQHGFVTSSGRYMEIGIGDDGNGAASVEWTFLNRMEAAKDGDTSTLYVDGNERISASEWLEIRTAIQAIVEADVAIHERPAYVFTPQRESNRRANLKMVKELGHLGFELIEDQGSVYLFRPGAGIATNGRIKPQDGWNPNFEEPTVYGSQEDFEAGQQEFYDATRNLSPDQANPRGIATATRRERQEAARSRAAAASDAGGTESGRKPGDSGEGELGQSETRGSIRYDGFKAGEFGSAVIRLGEASDLSTFLHEFGHLGHLILESMATDADAPAEFRAMWDNTLAWWGIDQANWDALSAEQKVPYFEQWARTFEAYLMDGKAPSFSLKEAFAAFRQWLVQIYRTVLRLDANLNPQIRDVFDRMLATDAEIAEARAAQGSDFALSREAFKSDEEFQAYEAAIAAVKDAQEAELRARVMDSYARKSKRWWRSERERVRDAATRSVDSDRARRALEWLAYQEWRTLPSTDLTDEGEMGYVPSADAMEEMPEDLPAMALDPEAVKAEWPEVALPVAINPRVDVDVVLAEAMRIKGVAKGRGGTRAQRLATAVRAWGGIVDADGRVRTAIGSGRKRPGLVNANGKTPEQLAARAAAEGYFGPGAARLFLNEAQAEQAAKEIVEARRAANARPQTLTSWVREQGGIADDRGDIAGGAGDAQRGFARLLRADGRSIDDLALAAWEAGFFPDANGRPSVAEFIDALDAEARGEARAADMEALTSADQADRLISFWQSMGIDTAQNEAKLKDALWGFANPLADDATARELHQTKLPDAGSGGAGNRVVYRGLNRPYDPANGGYYQSFTSSLDDAREYGPNVIAAHINPGRNLAIDGGGNNFNSIAVEQLPADVRARLHPSVGDAATTDQIAHAAREAGYDSVTVRNVHDNRWGERPVAGAEPRTIDFVFNTENIRPLDSIPPQASAAARSAERVKLTAADRALLDELGVNDAPDAGAGRGGRPLEGEVLGPTSNDVAPRERMSGRDFLSRTLENGVNPFRIIDENTLVDLQSTINQRKAEIAASIEGVPSLEEIQRLGITYDETGAPRLPRQLPAPRSNAPDGGARVAPDAPTAGKADEGGELFQSVRSRRRVIDTDQGEVIVNPTRADMQRMTRVPLGERDRAWMYDSVRFIVDSAGNVFAGAGSGMIHDDIARAARSAGFKLDGYQFGDSYGHGSVETGSFRRIGDAFVFDDPRNTARLGNPVELFQEGDDKAPTVDEFIAALIADLTNERQVYAFDAAQALASNQDLADAQSWFDANEIDLTKDKDEIRSQIADALEKAKNNPNLVDPDTAASWFGFSSGDELIQALSALKPRAVAIEDKIDQMLADEHGDINSKDKIQAAARLAAHLEVQAKRIEIELAALEKATGGRSRPVGNAARAYAEQQIQRMTVKQVRNADQYLAGERRAARNAMEFQRKGDAAQAAHWKQRQLISFWLYKFARDAAEEMDKAQSYFRKFDRDTVRAKIHAPLLDQIDQTLESIDLRTVPRISTRRRQSFMAWYDEMKAEGLEHMVAVDPDFLDAVRQRPFNSLTVEEGRAMRDAVKNFEHIGRRWREVLAARDNRLLDEAVAEMAGAMAQVKPFEATNPENHSPGVVERLDTGRQKLHAQLSRVEFVARAMDGMKENGPVWNGLFRPLTEARDREEARQQQAQRDIEALFSVYDAKDRADMWVKRKFYPQVPNRDGSRMGRNFTKQEILAIALNTGNDYNFNALIAGDNWSEAQVRALLDAAMDDRDWRFVQSLWDYVETFWPEIDALHRKATGVTLPKVEATPFQNRYGEWRGGYWHLEYDYGRDQRVRDEVEHGQVQEAFGGFRMRTMTPHGFAKARQGSGGRPVRLDLAVLTEHVNEVIHDLEFRLPVLNTWRIIKHAGFRSAFVRAAGQEMYDTLKPWLQYVATEQMPPERGFADILRLLRRNTPIALMGFALSTVAQQPAGIMGGFHRVGTARVMGKVLELASQPWTWLDHARFINARSTLMRNRSMISQREIREMVQEINSQGHIDAVTLLTSGTVRQKAQALGYLQKMMQRYAMFPLAYLDKWVSSAAWKAAYDRALAGHVDGVDASNEADVIAYADHIVRTTFGSGRPEDMSPIMRSSELGKIMTPAFSYFNTQYNQLFNEQTPGMMRGQISPIEFATFITFAMVLQALVSQWLAGRWEPGDDEDEDDRNRRLALEVAMTPTAGIPLIRDITRAALMKASTGRPTFGTSVPAIGAITSTGSGIGGAIHDLSDEGEISRASARDLTMAAGYWFGLPSRQLWTTGSYVSDVATGEEEAPWKSDQPIDSWSEAFLRDTR